MSCPDCYVGVYDDPEMTRTSGRVGLFQVKSVYLGVRLARGVEISRLTFDASFPGGFTVLDVTSYTSGAQYEILGTGAKITWTGCVSGTRLLFRVRVLGLLTPRDAVLQLRNAEAESCRDPLQRYRLPAGCYVLNPSGGTGCASEVAPATWSAMKELFR